MDQLSNNEYCYLCDTDITENSEENPLKMGIEIPWTKLIAIIGKYMPNINKYRMKHICKSCLDNLMEFDKSRDKWNYNETLIILNKGNFKGLRDIIGPKKKYLHICRLCLRETDIQDVNLIYHKSMIYQEGYVQKMIASHAPQINLTATENPIICHDCLNVIQTFDAFYQMCLQNHSSKKGNFAISNESSKNNAGEKVVHVQLTKTGDNTVVMRSLTEAESAVSSLPNIKDSPTKKSGKTFNGWTTQNVFDLVQNRKTVKNKTDDVCIISDDEETTLESNVMQKKKIFNSNKQRVTAKYPPRKKIRTSELTLEPYINENNNTLNSEIGILSTEPENPNTVPVKMVESENLCSLEINMSKVKDVLESNYRELAIPNSETVDSEVVSTSTLADSEIDIITDDNDPTIVIENSTQILNDDCSDGETFDIVEVEDSDSNNSLGDTKKEIISPSYVIHTEAIDESQDTNSNNSIVPKMSTSNIETECFIIDDPTFQEESRGDKLFESSESSGANIESNSESLSKDYASNNEHMMQQDVTPSIEINMTKLNQLFQTENAHTKEIQESGSVDNIKLEQEIIPTIEINMSKVNELFNTEPSETTPDTDDTREANLLKLKLSDYLFFKKTLTETHHLLVSDELSDFDNAEGATITPIFENSMGPTNKTLEITDISSENDEEDNECENDESAVLEKKVPFNLQYPSKKQSFTSAFEEFLQGKQKKFIGAKKPSEQTFPKELYMESNPIIIADQDEISDSEYCIWFPYRQIYNRENHRWSTKIFQREKTIEATVLEKRNGSRVYKCNICLSIMEQESQLPKHSCWTRQLKKRAAYKCKGYQCTFSTSDRNTFFEHQTLHVTEKTGYPKFHCRVCEFYASEKSLIDEHVKETHQSGQVNGVKLSKCPYCFFESDIPLVLSQHISVRHKVNRIETNGHQDDQKQLECVNCNFKTTSIHCYFQHLENRSCIIYNKCRFCNYQCQSRDRLTRHEIRSHSSHTKFISSNS